MPAMQDRAAAPKTRTPIVGEERLEKALRFLAESDQISADLKAQVERHEYACKLARARMFLLSTESSVEARKADAEKSHDVQDAEGKRCDCIQEFERLRAKRTTETLIVEVWRSVNANRRQGTI